MSTRGDGIRRIFLPGERSKTAPNTWCVAKLRIGGQYRDVTLSGITDIEEARSAALDYLAAAQEREERRAHGDDRPTTFAQLAKRYQATRELSKNEKRYIKRLVAKLGHLSLEDLVPDVARQAAFALYPKAGTETRNRQAMRPFAAIIHYGYDNRWMPYIRVPAIRPTDGEIDRRISPPAAGVEERLLDAATAWQPGPGVRKADAPYRRLLLLFLFRQGWRISETLALRWDQVHLVEKCFHLDVSKARCGKWIPMHPDIFVALANLPEGEAARAARERQGRVFCWVDRHSVYRWLQPLCNHIGVRFTPHMARHAFASRLNSADATTQDIQAAGSWTDSKAIQRYIEVDKARAAAVIARLKAS